MVQQAQGIGTIKGARSTPAKNFASGSATRAPARFHQAASLGMTASSVASQATTRTPVSCSRPPSSDHRTERFKHVYSNFPEKATNGQNPVPSPVSSPTVFNSPPDPDPSSDFKVSSQPLCLSKKLPNGVENQFVHIPRFTDELVMYPDRDRANKVIQGLIHGFDLGFRGEFTETSPPNNASSKRHKDLLTTSVNKEVERGHTAGPFDEPPFVRNHISPLGADLKPDGSARLIMDLSQPQGSSINEFISKEEFPTEYVHFDVATALVRKMGKGCLLSKVDIKHAFRLLPVRPQDWPLLVYFWEGKYYVDLKLPFGARSSPSIFTDFADLLCWIFSNNFGLVIIHYADDYLLFTGDCLFLAEENLDRLLEIFSYLDVPVATDKLVGPTTSIVYLGIEIDTINFVLSIPEGKVSDVIASLPNWLDRRTCKKVELLSLIGKLNFFAIVVRAGRLFVRRLIDLSKSVSRLHHYVTLNSEAKKDIQWWCTFLPTWNRCSFIPDPKIIVSTDIQLFTDAAKTIGFGAVFGNSWIQSSWSNGFANENIDFQEMFAIVAAVLTWGHQWTGKRVVVITDNKPITQIWSKGSSPSPNVMALVRKLFMFAASMDFSISFKHIFGHYNPIADALSRFQGERFRTLLPQADENATTIPPDVWHIPGYQQRDTISKN